MWEAASWSAARKEGVERERLGCHSGCGMTQDGAVTHADAVWHLLPEAEGGSGTKDKF